MFKLSGFLDFDNFKIDVVSHFCLSVQEGKQFSKSRIMLIVVLMVLTVLFFSNVMISEILDRFC